MALLQILHRCPHCSELCDFHISNLLERFTAEYSEKKPPLWESSKDSKGRDVRIKTTMSTQCCALSRCPRCTNPVMFVISAPRSQINTGQNDSYTRVINSYVVDHTYPEAKKNDSHPAWPEKIQKPFVDAQNMLDEGKSAAFVVTACRAVLDVATKELAGEGKSIFDRIEDLAKKGIVTGSLRDWAHEVRQRGAESVHDLDGGTPEQAKELVEFIRLFLHVTFELPQAILAKKSANP